MITATVTAFGSRDAGLRSRSRLDPALHQFVIVLPVFAVCGGLPFIGLGAVSRPLFMACGIAIAYFYWRRSPWLYITATLWFWTFTPLIRRLIDYRTGFNATDPVLALPNLMAALMLLDVLRDRQLFRRTEAQLGLLVLLPALWGLSVSLVNGQIVAGVVGAMDWVIPILYYFYIIAHAGRVAEAERCLNGFLALNGLTVVGYGLYQAFWPPAWDLEWMVAAGVELASQRFNQDAFRPFGSLNSGGIMAFWLSALLILGLHFRTLLSVVIVPGAGFLLLLTGVRSVAGVTVGCLVLAALIGQRKALSLLVTASAAVAMIVVLVSTVDPAIADRLTARFGSVDVATDDSALIRARIIRTSPAIVDRHPIGLGIGALGRGAVVSGDPDLVSIDFGPLATYLGLGWVAGTLYLGGLCVVVGNAALTAIRRRSAVAMVCGIMALGLLVQLAIVSIIGFAGMIMWICAGFAVTCVPAAATSKTEREDRSYE